MTDPTLDKAYGNLKSDHRILFIDETYNAPDEGMEHTFYTICGVLITCENLPPTREELCEIVEKNYWHTTDELRTSTGKATVVDLLEFCHEVDDLYFLAHKSPITEDMSTEDARQECLRGLFSHIGNTPELQSNTPLIVMEKRQDHAHDDADRALIKKLRQEKIIDRHTQVVITSPQDECLLWLPDLVAMAFRRKITHKDDTAQYFDKYIKSSTTVIKI